MFGGMLLACDDVVTEDQLSWAPGFTDLPKKRGKKKDLNKFDAGILPGTSKQNNPMDPQVRLLLEASWEAMVDAGNHFLPLVLSINTCKSGDWVTLYPFQGKY